MSLKFSYFRFLEELSQASASALGVDEADIQIDVASEQHDALFAIPCFKFASQLQKSPDEIASLLSTELSKKNYEADQVKGFVNIQVSPESLANNLSEDISNADQYGFDNKGHNETVVIDYIGLNLAKPFSVGHLRPTVQGAALVNLYRSFGYKVIGDSHLGDWGTPFGMWATAFELWGDDSKLKERGVYELGDLYVKFREDSETKPELIDQAKQWLKKLEDKEPGAVELHERFTDLSLKHMNNVLDRLKVKVDENLGESFYIPMVEEYLEKLLSDGLAIEQTDGTIIVNLEDQGIDTPILLRKGDGSYLYATTDILTIDYRMNQWKPSKIIYSVGMEQKFHFEQVFALSQKIGYEVELEHAWFGTINEVGEDGKQRKMSSRKATFLLENLLDVAEEKTKSMLPSDSEVSDKDVSAIAVGAIKFNDFKQSRKMNELFDWDSILSISGFSGPYIQYAAVRIGSILSKSELKVQKYPDSSYNWKTEESLLQALFRFPSVTTLAINRNEPNEIAKFLFDLAKEFNVYYENTNVLQASGEVLECRLWLLNQVLSVIKSGLGILGIEVPDKM